jgi:hypothetical protein
LFRQDDGRHWAPVVIRVAQALQARAEAGPASGHLH